MSGHALHGHPARQPLRIALLTVSDTRTAERDLSGSTARQCITEAGHTIADYGVEPDDAERVRRRIEGWLGRDDCDVVIISGGTGIAGRDRTPEAVTPLLELYLDGFGELFRALSFAEIGSAAMLSRAVGGIARGKPVFVLPGSPQAVELGLRRLVLPELAHIVGELRKDEISS